MSPRNQLYYSSLSFIYNLKGAKTNTLQLQFPWPLTKPISCQSSVRKQQKNNTPRDLYSTDKLITIPAIQRFRFYFSSPFRWQTRLGQPVLTGQWERRSFANTEKRLGLFCYTFKEPFSVSEPAGKRAISFTAGATESPNPNNQVRINKVNCQSL